MKYELAQLRHLYGIICDRLKADSTVEARHDEGILRGVIPGLEKFLEYHENVVAGAGLCAFECKMHCGYGHLQGCSAIKEYLADDKP